MATVGTEPNEFAIAMYSRLGQDRKNLFFSPFSIRTALALAHAGARGETASQIQEVLQFGGEGDELHVALARMISRFTASARAGYQMVVANSLWCQEGLALSRFWEWIDRHYGGGLNEVDFIARAEAARADINLWVEQETRNHIPGFLPPGSVDPQTRLVLTNAPLKADFSGINDVRPPHVDTLSITALFHKAFVEVDEHGTRAAAATAPGFSELLYASPRHPVTFRADHPFLFAIRDQRTAALLFLGRVTQPSLEN